MAIPPVYSDDTSPTELYYIAPIQNLPSILVHGILSQENIKRLIGKPPVDSAEHYDIGLRSRIGLPRKSRLVPESFLTGCANLYLRAHNADLKRRDLDDTCVLRIDPRILNQPGVFLTNKNATINIDLEFFEPGKKKFTEEETRLLKEPEDLVSKDDQKKAFQRKMIHRAEFVIPEKVDPVYIRGVFIANEVAQKLLNETWGASSPEPFPLSVQLQPGLFFPKVPIETSVGSNPCVIKDPVPLFPV